MLALASRTKMKLRQYVKFGVLSDTLDPGQLTSRIGVQPDEVRVKGSRHELPKPVPRSHWWIVRCDTRKVDVGAQVADVMARVTPARAALRELLAGGDAEAQLSVVRWFGDDDGDEEVGFVGGPDGSILREGVSLYGWHLDHDVLEFLADIGADLDVDEYDMLQVEENFAWPEEPK